MTKSRAQSMNFPRGVVGKSHSGPRSAQY